MGLAAHGVHESVAETSSRMRLSPIHHVHSRTKPAPGETLAAILARSPPPIPSLVSRRRLSPPSIPSRVSSFTACLGGATLLALRAVPPACTDPSPRLPANSSHLDLVSSRSRRAAKRGGQVGGRAWMEVLEADAADAGSPGEILSPRVRARPHAAASIPSRVFSRPAPPPLRWD